MMQETKYYFKGVHSTSNLIIECAKEAIIDIAKYLSEDNQILSLENFDPQNPEIIKIIDDKVNQFVDNFYVHNY